VEFDIKILKEWYKEIKKVNYYDAMLNIIF